MRKTIAIILAAPLLAAACATGGQSASSRAVLRKEVESGPQPSGAEPTTAIGERMLVRHAELDVTVDRLDPAEQRVSTMAKALGGYVENAGSHSGALGGGRRLTLRVPSTVLDAAVDSVARLGKVTARSAGAEDVTDQVVDLDARVTSLRASRDRLRQLLDRATTVTDVVSVEKELSRIQAELDSLESRLKQARGEVALARLVVSLQPRHVLGPLGLAFAGVGWVLQKLFFIR
jgi:hypothetical protein